jgi:hypothetical protein
MVRREEGSPRKKLREAVAAYHWAPPSAEELSKMKGFRKATDFTAPEVAVFDDNWPILALYARLQTQWRVGPGGKIGLDYGIFISEIDRMKLDRDDYDDMMEMLGVVEREALRVS